MKGLLLVLVVVAPTAQAAPTLSLPPTALRTVEESPAPGSYALPLGAWAPTGMPTRATEGEVTRTAWQIRDGDVSTPSVFSELRDQLVGEAFDVLFQCDTDACGGFDFRFAIHVLPEPEMHVDLGDFRFLSAERVTDTGPEYVSLLVSRSSDSAYVQMTRVGPALAPDLPLAKAETVIASPAPGTIGEALIARGKVVLNDLSFSSGTTELQPGDYATLEDLAVFLNANPDKSVALVGHTDAEGSLAANVSLSRKRAQAVLRHLVETLGCNPGQVSADGVGYLSPIASNLTDEGRTKNRRVEALLTSTR